MKKISVVIPCYNEVENVEPMAQAVRDLVSARLSQYSHEIIFIDNYSTDGTREKLRLLCRGDKNIKAILNASNFGFFNSQYYGLLQGTGDCVVLVCCDFQEPIALIPDFIKEWEAGHKVVAGQKTRSKENPLMYFLRSVYYKTIRHMSTTKMIDQFMGFGLYDKSFVDFLRTLDDPTPWLRGIVAEYGNGFNMKVIKYEQNKRRAGKTHFNFYRLYDSTMISFTAYTKVAMRLATFTGFVAGTISVLAAVACVVFKLLFWDKFPAGYASQMVVMCLLGSVQLFFIGFLGEYVMSINTRVIHRPLVVEAERINFGGEV